MKTEVVEAASKLLGLIKRAVAECISSGTVPPEFEPYYARKVLSEPGEGPFNPFLVPYHSGLTQKPNWVKAADHVFEIIKASAEFKCFVDLMSREFTDLANLEKMLADAVRLIVGGFFHGEDYEAAQLSALLETELKGEPLVGTVELEVYGLGIPIKNFEFRCGPAEVSMRQPERSDFEREIPFFNLEREGSDDVLFPSVFLKFIMPMKSPRDLHEYAAKAKFILRMLKVSSVDFARQRRTAESLIKFTAIVTQGGRPRVGRHAVILDASEIHRMPAFWQTVAPRIPQEIYEMMETKETFIKIGYQRYCDSIFHVGSIEGKLAFGVMSLEALLLGDDKTELRHRLSMRTAKLIGKFEHSAQQIHSEISKAYDIRSTYVHGGHLSASERSKIEKKLGIPLDDLWRKVLNYTRMSILIYVLTRLGKDELLRSLDAAMLTPLADKTLDDLLKREGNLISLLIDPKAGNSEST